MSTAIHPIRVYYEDTDAGGVVYYANYLKFAERARTEALRQAGLEQTQLLAEHGVLFVVRRCSADYLRPARLDDLLTVESQWSATGRASITLQQRVLRVPELLVTLEVKLAVVDSTFRPTKLPQAVLTALETIFGASA